MRPQHIFLRPQPTFLSRDRNVFYVCMCATETSREKKEKKERKKYEIKKLK